MSELALKLIAENKRSKSTVLDLGNCGLRVLPDELGDLVWLETLILSAMWSEWNGMSYRHHISNNSGPRNHTLSSIALVSKLIRLRTLVANTTQITDLAPLSGLNTLELLDLRNTEVIDLAPLSGLSILQSLLLSGTKVIDLAALSGLSALQSLLLSGTKVIDLAPLSGLRTLQSLLLSGTKVSDLAPLSGLSALQSLYLSETKVIDLPPLSGLSALQSLDLSGTKVIDLVPLSGLGALQSLYLNGTKVNDLTPLSGLITLQSLDLNGTKVSDLTPLSGLITLQSLDLNGTKVSDLTPLLHLIQLGRKVSLKHYDGDICVNHCPLISPPVEIVAQGNKAILNYFHERDAGRIDHLYEAKMLILGEGGAGKTSLLRRLYQPNLPLPEEQETTKGIAIHRHDFPLTNGRNFRLNVWDFGGQEIYHATHQFFLTRRSLYVLLDDTRQDHQSVSDPGFKDWLDIIESFGGESPVLIFQNEKGGRSKTIGFNGIQARYSIVKACHQGDLNQPGAAAELEQAIKEMASKLPHIGDMLPAKWIKVREDIEQRAIKVPTITLLEYFEIYRRHLPFDRTKALHLSRYFHDLGVFLHFQDDPMLKRTVVLQNDWATRAVYHMLDCEQVKAKFGHFNQDDCVRLWHADEYCDMFPELLALMQRFEICYLLPDSKQANWFAPQLLPANKPADLINWNKAGDLVLRYRYDFMPKAIISRLMVRQHRLVPNPEQACLTCVLFSHGASSATAELLPNGSEIELRARGPERKALLSVLAMELDAINDGFPGLSAKIEKRIPCQCAECQASITPFTYDEKNLRRRMEKNVPDVQCDISFDMQLVPTLLDGVNPGDLPDWAKRSKAQPPRIIRIFLAASEDLQQDRNEFELYFRRQNDNYRVSGQYLEIVRGDNLFDAMSRTRKQDDYLRELEECDVFVCLVGGKAGAGIVEEFDCAWAQFKTLARPFIFTFFKDVATSTSHNKDAMVSIWDFQKKLADLGHTPTLYKTDAELKLRFAEQLGHLLPKLIESSAK